MDANILVSVLNNEYPLFTYTSRVLSLTDNRKFEVYTSPLCLAIAYYFAEKKSGNKTALQKINILSQKIKIAGMTEDTVKRATENKKKTRFKIFTARNTAQFMSMKRVTTVPFLKAFLRS